MAYSSSLPSFHLEKSAISFCRAAASSAEALLDLEWVVVVVVVVVVVIVVVVIVVVVIVVVLVALGGCCGD